MKRHKCAMTNTLFASLPGEVVILQTLSLELSTLSFNINFQLCIVRIKNVNDARVTLTRIYLSNETNGS